MKYLIHFIHHLYYLRPTPAFTPITSHHLPISNKAGLFVFPSSLLPIPFPDLIHIRNHLSSPSRRFKAFPIPVMQSGSDHARPYNIPWTVLNIGGAFLLALGKNITDLAAYPPPKYLGSFGGWTFLLMVGGVETGVCAFLYIAWNDLRGGGRFGFFVLAGEWAGRRMDDGRDDGS